MLGRVRPRLGGGGRTVGGRRPRGGSEDAALALKRSAAGWGGEHVGEASRGQNALGPLIQLLLRTRSDTCHGLGAWLSELEAQELQEDVDAFLGASLGAASRTSLMHSSSRSGTNKWSWEKSSTGRSTVRPGCPSAARLRSLGPVRCLRTRRRYAAAVAPGDA